MNEGIAVRLLYNKVINILSCIRFISKKYISVSVEENIPNKALDFHVKFKRFFKTYKISFSISWFEIANAYEKQSKLNKAISILPFHLATREMFIELLDCKLKQELSLIGFISTFDA